MVASMVKAYSAGAKSQMAPVVWEKAIEEPQVPREDGPPQTVDALVRHRAQTFAHQTVVSYPSSGIEYVDYTMQQLDVFAYRVACHYQDRLPVRSSSDEKPKVIAVLGPSNLEYLVTMLALIKLGHTILFLSTRISQEAVESLMRTTQAETLLIDARHEDTANGVKGLLPSINVFEIASRAIFEFPVKAHADTRLDGSLDHSIETSNIVYIIHSSGSTGLPKPIYQTHKAALANYAVNMNMKAFITLPLYHNHGICNFFRAIYSGKSIHMYNADLPLTSDYLSRMLRNHHFEIFYGVPYALKLLAETEAGIKLLQELKIVMYGGSACPDELGDLLVNHGVNLVSHYGATEVGQLMTSFRPKGDKAWNYVREHERLSPFLNWIPRGPNLFECCVLEGWPPKLTSNQPDGSYATKDLFEPHPTISGAWKYIARLDDTIVLVNGEKFNPVQIEGRIRSTNSVTEAVVFGAGRPYLGLLVVPAESTKALSSDDILEQLWPTIQSANQTIESYARISKNMIKILPHDCEFPRTDKGSVIRQAFYKRFANDIDEAYDAADVTSTNAQVMNPDELKAFLKRCLAGGLSKEVDAIADDTDFFSLGMDSLQAIQLRSEILRNVDVGGKKLGQNVVFDYPTIAQLSAYLSALRTGQLETQASVESEMGALVEKYTSFHPRKSHKKSSVVVTGATGSLGAHVVSRLVRDATVDRVFCLVRANDPVQALQRVRDSLVQRKAYHDLTLQERRKLRALPFNQSDSKLGLDARTYRKVARDLRSVIHCAWSVNFNLKLSSFERDCIAGVHNLISLCLAADSTEPSTFNFCSSVSAVARAPDNVVPESLSDFTWAQQMGYAQSKSVAERICIRAAELTGIKARVLRVGQIIADTQHGIWNATEAIPMQIQTALTVGALPQLSETPSWLPVDTVAQAVVDISFSDADSLVTNVVNKETFNWTSDLLPALRTAGLQFEVVEPREWVRRLRASNPDPKANPPIKLVDFFASKYDKDEFSPSKKYATEVACSLSEALAGAPVLDQNLVNKFVQYFLSSPWKIRPEDQTAHPQKTVIIFSGPCGCGKSTVGQEVATWLGGAFIEGDSLHTHEAVNRMASKSPLSDDDRWAWLDRIQSHAREAAFDLGYDVIAVSCSALRKSYRDRLRDLKSTTENGQQGLNIVFVDLQASQEVLVSRTSLRKGHYMSAEMVEGQIRDREDVQADEDDVWPINGEKTTDEVMNEVRWAVSSAINYSK